MVRNKKILIISSLYGLSGGGAGIITKRLAERLVTRGYEVVVITIGGPKRMTQCIISGVKIYKFLPVNLYPLQEKDLHPKWQKIIWQLVDIYNPLTYWSLRQILLREKPDIVHIHKMRGFSGAIWDITTKLFPGRVVQTCHDFESMSPEGLLQGKVGQWAAEGKWPINLYQRLRKWFSRSISVVTTPSAFAMKQIVASGLFSSAIQVVIPNAHEYSNNELRERNDRIKDPYIRSNQTRLLYLGRLEPEKGIRELCQTFVKVASNYPSMFLSIGGWGSLEEELRNRYIGNPQIEFLGRVWANQKSETIEMSDALIMPSIGLEIFGIVIVEGYAFGKPIIASRIGGIPEIVNHGITGWLIEPGNIKALTLSIEAAGQKPEVLRQMSQACFNYSFHFSIDKITRKYEDVYRSLWV
jgi:glycosyltransferase involved in cell wall biosynthesis